MLNDNIKKWVNEYGIGFLRSINFAFFLLKNTCSTSDSCG